MKKFLLGLFSGFVLAVLAAVIVFFVFVRIAASFGEKNATVADNSTLIFRLEGAVPERPPTEVPIPFLDNQTTLSMTQVWHMFRNAAADSRVKAIVFEPYALQAGWAQMEEIHDEIATFKKSGKPIIAFLRNPGGREYYLASGCERIYMTPEDSLDLKGLALEATYFKNTLDKLGLKMDVIHAGKYKDAGDIFTQTSMTPETREVLNNVLDQLYGDLVSTIGTGRKKQPEQVKALIDAGPYTADQAVGNGLVDKLEYEDQVAGDVAAQLHQKELTKLSSRTYVNVSASSLGLTGPKRIALIVGEGEITRGSGSSSAFGQEQGIVSGPFIKLLRDAENDSTIKGAIIRVNSPGGDGVASDDILHEAKNLSAKKPVVISMGNLAASGGYFISVTGDPIVAYPDTITGSIGVIFMRLNVQGLFEKVGVTDEILKRGRFAEIDSSVAPLTDEERAKIRQQVDDFYKSFVTRVASGRKRPFGQIEELAQGRVWMGAQAKQNGLVDQLGGLDTAIELVKKRANIGPNEKITLVTMPAKKTIFELLANRQEETPSIDIKVEQRLNQIFGPIPWKSLHQGGFQKILPVSIAVH